MTIIVGVICKEGIVLGCDSQASSVKGVPLKRTEYTKIYKIELRGNGSALLSGAGTGAFITRASEILEDKCKNTVCSSCREFANICEDVVTEIFKRYVVDKGKALGMSKATLNHQETSNFQWQDDALEPPGVWMLTGVYCGGQNPEWCLYSVHPSSIAEKADKYDAIGSGSAIAEYLLPRLWSDKLTLDQAVKIVVYVVEEVKKIDPFCGGPTQIMTLSKSGAKRLSPREVKKIVDEVMETDEDLADIWRDLILGTEKPPVKAKAKRNKAVDKTTT